LLIVMATLVLISAAAAICISASATIQAARRIQTCAMESDDLSRACDRPIQNWLETKSAKVVLPSTAARPCVEVLHDEWSAHGQQYEVAITAFDQCGMAPIGIARSGSPLRSSLPSEVLRRLDAVSITADFVAGLDLFVDLLDEHRESSPFPCSTVADKSAMASCLGAMIATHNRDPVRINVNTAPIELVQAALAMSGRGGIQQIIAARDQGKQAFAAGGSMDAQSSKFALQLVSASTIWSFRVDIRVGPVLRSWWEIYEPRRREILQPSNSKAKSSQRKWECTQRLVVTQ